MMSYLRVKCVSIQKTIPHQVKVGNHYYVDAESIAFIDCIPYGDVYIKYKDDYRKIGSFRLEHFEFDIDNNDDNCLELENMSQYYLDRDLFCAIVRNTIGIDRLYDAFTYGIAISGSFAWFIHDDEYYIINLDSGMIINWYKHIGRTNTCSQEGRTVGDYYKFFLSFKKELDYYEKHHK